MLGIPFFSKKSKKTEGYVFMLFLTDAKVFGFAFEEAHPDHRSMLYIEPIDSYLKDLADKVELVITNCEKDLGKDIYLQDTVLIVSSFFLSESSTVKEDTRKAIATVFKELDLANLGYITSAEFFSAQYGETHVHWVLLEETAYDIKLYSFTKTQQKGVTSIARVQDEEELRNSIIEQSHKNHIVAWIQNQLTLSGNVTYINPQDIPDYGVRIYTRANVNDSAPTSEIELSKVETKPEKITTKEVLDSQREQDIPLVALPSAPGFGNENNNVTEENEILENPTTDSKKSVFSARLLSGFLEFKERITGVTNSMTILRSWWLYVVLGIFLCSAVAVIYFLFFHSATITLVTNKENFSTTISFPVGKGSSVSSVYTGSYTSDVQTTATGEDVIGEKANGTITLYNRTFETKTIAAGTELVSDKGTVFLLDEDVAIASASGVPVQDGKRPADVTAQIVGTDGNIEKNSKLTIDGVSQTDVYAVSSVDFSGGFKKVVIVFSDEDKKKLDSLTKQAFLREVKTAFLKEHTSDDILFEQTAMAQNVHKDYSAKVGEEVRTVNATDKGSFSVYYTSDVRLRTYVQQQKLKDKEFVKDTFSIQKTKLEKGKDPSWSYSAIISGKIQKFIDRVGIAQKLTGKTVPNARVVLNGEHTVTSFSIKTYPIPLPIMPYSKSRIIFQFSD
ncbi:MAG: baseplate J/gp47 family protein [Candidatus Roizmanbacteria bacterium]|nr:baseplate J/gp47 family protein [Candidatus Roizmanbacteria bacterium]